MKVVTIVLDKDEPVCCAVKLNNTILNERKAQKLVLLLVERGWSFNYRWKRVGKLRYIHKFWIYGISAKEFNIFFGKRIDSVL